MRLSRLATPALLLALVAPSVPRPLAAQAPVVGVACTAGIPGCMQLDLVFSAVSPIELATLSLKIAPASPWRFLPIVPGSTTAIVEARDDLGPYGAAATIDVAGVTLDLDFLGTGFPFTLGASSVGFVRVTVDNQKGAEVPSITVSYSATGTGGDGFDGTATPIVPTTAPEPASAGLVLAGASALLLAVRRRRGLSARR